MDGVTPWTVPQSVPPTAVFDLPGSVRGVVAFAVVLLLGTTILWRFDGVVDRSIDATAARPLSALGYGVAAHVTILFFGVYAASQFGQLPGAGRSLGAVGLWLGMGLLLVVAGLGFTVVGSAIVELRGERRRRYGLLMGALTAGVLALVDPVIGIVMWVVVVSMGIGGPVRTWFLASEDVNR